ncbi:hypothetical protein HDU81_001527, partial [Chytriomyces hyalinus]
VQHVFKFRRLCKAINESLLTTQFALLNMELPVTLTQYQKDAIWLQVPDKYQAALNGEKMSELESMQICVVAKTAIPFPKSIVLLSKLKTLDLSRSTLTGVIPDVFGGLLNLMLVLLCDNQLEGHVPASFNSLSSLVILNLSKNRLTGHIPDFSNLNALILLDISNNQLTGPIPTIIGSPSKLEHMYLGHNQFSSIPSTIANLVKLSFLDFSNNPISGDLPGEFWRLRELQTVMMQNCGLTGSLAGVGALTLLEELYATDNDLTDWIPPSQQTQLRALRLFGNPR